MKIFFLFWMLAAFTAGNVYAQKPADPKEMALMNLKIDLKEIKDLTPKQLNQLVDIEIKIDKEYPFLTTMSYPTGKKRVQFLESIFALREKLYPSVLTPEQMEQFKVILQKYREHLQNTNSKNKKS